MRALLLLVAVQLIVVSAIAFGQGERSTIGVDEVRPGMRGYGLTVFRGTRPERFDVEVIDVLHNFQPDQDLILVRTDHPVLDHASTVAGMSGSPIYLDGRLAGAYAYGWPFGKDPVAGVTPIANMLAEIGRPVRPDSFPGADILLGLPAGARTVATRDSRTGRRAQPASAMAGLAPYLGQTRRHALLPLAEYAARSLGGAGPSPATGGLTRAATPIMLGGFGPAVARMLEEQLSPFGLVALQAGGAGERRRSAGEAERFLDGGAIGVQLIRGDISATGIGTVTHVRGRRLVAFGHPMMEAGELGLPTSTARVLHVLASEARSFKIAEALEPLGTLVHDRQAAIVVDTAHNAATVPVRIRVRGIASPVRDTWNVEVASHRVLTPVLVLSAVANAVKATSSDQTDVIFTARSRVELENHGTIEVVDQGYMAAGPASTGALGSLRLFDLIEAAYGNPFEKSRPLRIELDLEVRFARDVFEIIDASVASTEVDPGSRVNVHVVLRRFGEAEQVRIVPVDIPTHAAGKKIEIRVEAADEVDLEQPEARSLADVVRSIRDRYPATSLAVSLKLPMRGLRFAGHVVRGLPGSALDTLQLVGDTARGQPFTTQRRELIEMGRIVTGSATLNLDVRETRDQ